MAEETAGHAEEGKKKHAGGRPPVPLAERINKRIEKIRARVDRTDSENPALLDYPYLFELVCGGLTDDQIARVFEVETMTIWRWKQDDEFLLCQKNAKEEANTAVERSLWRQALGFSVPAEKVFQYEGQVIVHEYMEYHAPNVTAAAIWLNNRSPERWKRNANGENVDPNRPLVINVTLEKIGGKRLNGHTNGENGTNGNGATDHTVPAARQ